MSLDWWTVKPSASPPLSWAEVLALPAGMVVIAGEAAVPLLVLDGLIAEERRVCNWVAGRRWGRPFTLLEIDRAFRLPPLPRLSFARTTQAVRERRKTVTRRLSLPSWWKERAYFLGVDRIRQAGAQGLCIGRCGPANKEPLVAISQDEVDREGFPATTPAGFCAVFRSTAPRDWDGWVWRLPFSYLEIPE